MVQKYSSTCSHTDSGKGTVRWQAPELLNGEQSTTNTRASDVYAFGSVLYEVWPGIVLLSKSDHSSRYSLGVYLGLL
jgi:serine/threonine protein kinase